MDSLASALSRMAWHPVPEGVEPRASALCAEVKRVGVPVGRPALYRANTCTREQFDRLAREAREAAVRAYAEQQRRMRQELWAEEAVR